MFSRFDTTIQFVFFWLARWVSGDLWTSFNLAPWDDRVLSSSCMSLWFAVNLIIMSQDPIPKVVQYRNLAKMTWHFRLLKQHTTIIIYIHIYSLYNIYIYTECIVYFIPIYDVFVSSIMCPIWLSFYESYFFNDYVEILFVCNTSKPWIYHFEYLWVVIFLENLSHLLLKQSCSMMMVWVMEVLSIWWRWTVRRRCSANSDWMV